MFEDAPSATAGITGKRDKLLGKPGQALPMQPVRAISFDTDEGSLLSLDVSPKGDMLVLDMLGDIYTLPVTGGKSMRLIHITGMGTGWAKHHRYALLGGSKCL